MDKRSRQTQALKTVRTLKGIKKEYDKIQKGLESLLKKEVNEYFTTDIKEKRVTILSKKLDKLESFQKQLEELNDEEKRINMVDADAPAKSYQVIPIKQGEMENVVW